MTKTVTFAAKQYAQTGYVGKPQNVIALDDPTVTSPGLLELYNLVSANLGRGRVKRFADLASARRRTWAILEEYDAQGPAGAEPAQKKAEKPKADRSVPYSERKVPPSERAAKQDKAETPAPAASAPANTVERWRTPKRREPSKRCYMPRPGSKQDKAYQLLTQPEGIRVEDLCTEMSKLDTVGKNSTEWKEPGTIWGSLNYLFVTQKGYGLDFDGERIKLLKGKEEVPFPSTKKA